MLSLLEGLENLHVLPLQDYKEFLRLMSRAEFVVTDGGSIQEECAVLGKPCLILRHRTERPDGIGENAFLWDFDSGKLDHFLENYKSFRKEVDLHKDASPAMRICDILITISGQL
jgi:UDP-N-acetylglucosamine 2-epimerase (non-hydrolysing)